MNAICSLYPNAAIEMTNENDFLSLTLRNPDEVGTIDKSALDKWLIAKRELEPMLLLRKERNRLLAECDWVSLRAVSTYATIPNDWAAYMQALRDLPYNSQPMLTPSGHLDMQSVNWPVKPES